MKLLLFFVVFTFVNSMEALELSAFKDFPFGIICDHFDAFYYDSLTSEEGLEGSEYDGSEDRGVEGSENEGSEESEYESSDGSKDDPESEDVVKCIITRDGETLFNETFLWEDKYRKGVFAVADNSWNDAEISVHVSWGDRSERDQLFELTIQVLNSIEVELKRKTENIGEESTLDCFAPIGEDIINWIISENQFESITTVWYKGNYEIGKNDPDFEYEKPEFVVEEGEFGFDNLKIRNSSLSTTPGKYHCVLKFKNKQLTAKSYQLCLQKPFKENSPSIVASNKKYKVAPGGSIIVTCTGHTGTKTTSASQAVTWYKYGDNYGKCSAMLTVPEEKNCNSIIHRNNKYCEPLLKDEIADAKKHRLDDNFTATFTMRDLTKADSGVYTCILQTARNAVRSNFTIIVEESLEDKSTTLTITLGVVGGCIIVAILLILLFHIYMTSILYFLKHYFAPYETLDRKYLAYMVYSADVFFDLKNNMLQDTDRYFRRLNHPVYDPNNNAGHAGAPIATNVTETLRRCMAVVLFVTPQLLDSHGNGDNEIYEVYQALENNIGNLNMRVVFICLEETKKRVIMQAGKGNEFCVMLRRFMGRQGNTVILWKPKNQRAFHRALYVAMPKLKTEYSTSLLNDHSAV